MRLTLMALAAGGMLLTACSSSPSTTNSPPQAHPTTSGVIATPPVAVEHPLATNLPNVTIAPPGSMSPGPFTITPIVCGKLTAAQQSQFGTTAKAGFIYRFTNNTDSTTGDPKLSVNFLVGSTVVTNNVPGAETPVAPGQSGTQEVDGIGASGQNVTFTSCQIMSYAINTGNGIDTTEYAG
jgi:hypothetical protein